MSEAKTTTRKAKAPDSCLTCRFYLMPDSVCRRYPPTPIAMTTKRTGGDTAVTGWRGVFPSMLPVGWCGEFKAVAS